MSNPPTIGFVVTLVGVDEIEVIAWPRLRTDIRIELFIGF